MMRPKKARGDGTVEDVGRYETQGERKRDSVVALEISSAEPGSGVSGRAEIWARRVSEEKRSAKRNSGERSKIILHIRDDSMNKIGTWGVYYKDGVQGHCVANRLIGPPLRIPVAHRRFPRGLTW